MESKIRVNTINKFENKGIRGAELSVSEENGKYRYVFTVTTDVLYRMKSEEDNKVKLKIDGVWYFFAPSLISDYPSLEIDAAILENNNKRSRYKVAFTLDKLAEDAEAEGLMLL